MLYEQPLGWLLIFFAGFLASAVNAVAGGGSLISFPMLVGVGIPEREANATNSLALWPGSLSAALGFWNKLAAVKGDLILLIVPSLIGGLLGGYLLVVTPSEVFAFLVPILILFATILLAVNKRIKQWSAKSGKRINRAGGVAAQFAVAVYGGYFGAGIGIMMLAFMGLMLDHDIHELNAIKNWLGLIIKLSAGGLLLVQGLVLVEPAIIMTVGTIVGGYAAARISQRVDSEKVRKGIIVYGFIMTAVFLYQSVAA